MERGTMDCDVSNGNHKQRCQCAEYSGNINLRAERTTVREKEKRNQRGALTERR